MSRKVGNKNIPLISNEKPKSPIPEQYRLIRSNLHFASVDRKIKTIVITSPEPSDGKTTTSVNLAIILAQQGKKVLLVDADLRKPSIHHAFRASNLVGLTNVLTKDLDLEQAISITPISNLKMITSGPVPPNPSELLDSKAMKSLFEVTKEEFDYVIFDTPPILAVTDSQIMANNSDGVIMVVSSRKTKKARAMKAKSLLEQANSLLIGVVVNGVKMKKGDNYYQYY